MQRYGPNDVFIPSGTVGAIVTMHYGKQQYLGLLTAEHVATNCIDVEQMGVIHRDSNHNDIAVVILEPRFFQNGMLFNSVNFVDCDEDAEGEDSIVPVTGDDDDSSSGDKHAALSSSARIGIIVAAAVSVFLVVCAIIYCTKKRSMVVADVAHGTSVVPAPS
jgi:threonine synthase